MVGAAPPSGAALAEALIHAAGDGLVAIDEQGVIIIFNPAAGRIFGQDPSQMLGKGLESLFVPGMFSAHQQYVVDFFAGHGRGVVGTAIETVGRHSSGASVPIEISLTSTQVEGRTLVLASIRDITERQESLRRNQLLVEQLTQAQKMEALGTLAAGIAHDFNNMLGAIMGFSSAMTRELDQSHRHFEDANQILTIARRAKRLTDKLLAFSRKSDVKTEAFSVNRMVRDVLALLSRTIPKSIVFKTKLAQEVWSKGDRTQIEQVLLNLCLNARDAMPDGGELQIETARRSLDSKEAEPLGLPPGDYCRISAQDTGLGMDAATVSRALEPFFSTKPTGEGSGLGLSLVYSTIRSHGGQVSITSEEDKGTEVVFYLPATDTRPVPDEPEPTEKRQSLGQGETILLVDDEKHLRDMAKRLLEGLGYNVLLAESGEEAEALYRQQHETIDLVILDVVLVGISGAETLDRLKEIDEQVRVLVSSGYSPDGEPKHLLRRGVCGFIQKPYGIEEVSQAIQKALAGAVEGSSNA
jgi:PAS domain S-box-containing protein